ncbi:MAG: LacI family DNA-binding transcriptional regulator [Brevundimonas sp.]
MPPTPDKAPTVSDVARVAGVSPMTVSRVVNNQSGVKASTRDAVMRAIEALGYAPNAAARSLARAGAGRIGLLYSNPSAGYLGEILLGALEGAHQTGAQLLIGKCDSDTPSEQAAIQRLINEGAGGIILPPPHGESWTAIAEVEAHGVEAVAIAAGRFRSVATSIRIDDMSAAAEMTRYLLSLGHRRIGFIKGAPNQSASAERLIGFETELSQAAPPAEGLIESGEFTYRSGFEAAERLLSARRPPSAIFASNDEMAVAAIAAARRRGLDVPRDLTVVGFDDTPLASAVWPALTTIRQPIAEMAEAAVTRLVRGPTDDPDDRDRVVDHVLVVRESSGPPAT